MEWTGLNDLREKFLSFFESKGHLRLPSFSLIPKDDNSLLLINSGMAPMKKYFTGEVTPPRRRVTTCQKCIRTPDIDRVGITSRHGTFFEMLRESGARMPGIMGQTLSIVGALVVGQAAVDAKIVSAPILIVVALTGISGLMVPRLKGYVILHRFFLLTLSCILGLYGYLLGEITLLAGLFGMSSMGVPIMPDAYARHFQDYKDLYFRAPWKDMLRRPQFLSPDKVRQAGGKKA